MITPIYIYSIRPDDITSESVNSIIKTVDNPKITIVKRSASCANNMNFVFNMAKEDKFIIMNDDIILNQKNWDKMLFESLDYAKNIALVAPRVDIPKINFNQASFNAPKNCLIEFIRTPAPLWAIKRNNILADEQYKKAGCEDIDYVLQLIHKKLRAIVDTRVTVIHPKIPSTNEWSKNIQENKKLAHIKWGEMFRNYGRDLSKVRILKCFGECDDERKKECGDLCPRKVRIKKNKEQKPKNS